MSAAFDLCGSLRRIRRRADLSQRELAAAAGLSKTAVAQAEAGSRDLPVGGLVRAASVAGLRLVLVDAEGAEVRPMHDGAVRDMGCRRFPAHLDTRYGDEDWWHGDERYSRSQPWYTFDRLRWSRDVSRDRLGTPDDHQLPQPGDSPEERRAARKRAAVQRRQEEIARLRLGQPPPPVPEWICDCPPTCEELEDWEGPPKHAEDCPCRCDLG